MASGRIPPPKRDTPCADAYARRTVELPLHLGTLAAATGVRSLAEDELGDLTHRVDVADRDVQRRDRAVVPRLESLFDALGRADERDLVGERTRHRRDRLVAFAFEK